MVQHLLIGDIAALLLVLGLTGPLLQPMLALRALRPPRRSSRNPLVALPLWALNLYVWHIPALYEARLGSRAGPRRSSTRRFLVFGLPDVDAAVRPAAQAGAGSATGAKLGYVIAVRFAGAILGNVLMWSGTVLYPDYAPGERDWGICALADQGTAGVIDDDRGHGFVDPRRARLALLPRPPARASRSRSCSTSPTRPRRRSSTRRAPQRAVAAGQGALLRASG